MGVKEKIEWNADVNRMTEGSGSNNEKQVVFGKEKFRKTAEKWSNSLTVE